jgi:hypothetical protein
MIDCALEERADCVFERRLCSNAFRSIDRSMSQTQMVPTVDCGQLSNTRQLFRSNVSVNGVSSHLVGRAESCCFEGDELCVGSQTWDDFCGQKWSSANDVGRWPLLATPNSKRSFPFLRDGKRTEQGEATARSR